MLQVTHSNRLEVLFEIFCEQRRDRQAGDPFRADQVLVANPGIGRWLSLKLCEREGIAANIDYPLPASYIWQLYRDHLPDVPESSAFNKPRLQWTLMQLLQALPANAPFEPLHAYLEAPDAEQAEIKRVQLASKIADVFDQYLVYRPQWLREWEGGQRPDTAPGNWQAALWRQLRERLDEPHRATLHRDFLAAAGAGRLNRERLPERLFIFNVVSIAPSYLDVLVALAAQVPVELYLLNPSVEYWDEITARKRLLKLRRAGGEQAPGEVGNPLLAATGRLGQNALRLLHQRGSAIHEENFSVPSERAGRLGQLQREILMLEDPHDPDADSAQAELPLGDSSVELHCVHSVLREVQVLHDQLLARFERLPGLQPADIVVMVPDVDQYAPAVAAVFGAAPVERYIPWEIADRSLRATDPVVQLLRALLDLPQSQFRASEVLAWLAQPVLARRFGLESPECQALIAAWVEDSGARRLLGGSPLAAASDGPLNSWSFALRRLLVGYASGDPDVPVAGVYASAAVDGSDAAVLGRLIDCLDALGRHSESLRRPRPMQAWLDAFNLLVGELLQPDDEEASGIQQLRDCLSALAESALLSGYQQPLSASAMLALLDNALAGAAGKTQRFLTGRVTISSLVPLRSVPFRVVCLLGLNDGDFPRQNRPVSFDLIARNPAPGDRSVREDDHYLFLEALLSARDELYLSWRGRNPVDGKEQAPSVLLAELRDYLSRDGQELAVVQHPLQAFSPRYFDASEPALYSYADEWLPSGRAPTERAQPPQPVPGPVSLAQLLSFWRDPGLAYCRQVLRLELGREGSACDDSEPFELDALAAYQQRATLLRGATREPPLTTECALAAAVGRGQLPHGYFGERAFAEQAQEAEAQAERLLQLSGQALPPAAFELDVEDWRLQGQLEGLQCGDSAVRLLLARPGRFGATDLINLGLRHLCGCAAGVLQADSAFVARDATHRLAYLPATEAQALLAPWLRRYGAGQQRALAFFARPSLALLQPKGDPLKEWQGDDRLAGVSRQEATRLLWPEVADPRELEDFEAIAEELLAPLLSLLQEERA